MTMLPGMGPPKQEQAVLFDPQKEKDAKRKKMLAELLVAKGNQPLKNETAGGMTVARSPWENINQGAEKYLGEYQMGLADKEQTAVDQQRGKLYQEALAQLESNPQGAAGVLMQDPSMGEGALKMYQDALNAKREEEMTRERWAHEKELFGLRAASGGNTPAGMQVADRMFELEQAMSNPNLSPQERFLAERRYNLLGQAQKTYGYAPGAQQSGPFPGYENVFAGQQAPADFNGMSIPPVNMAQGAVGQPSASMPLPPSGYPQDPVAAHAQAVAGQQDQIGVNPMQRQELANPMQPQNLQPGGMGVIPGYGDAVSNIAAQKKSAEATAESDAKYMAEGRQRLPQAQRALQDAERSSQNIMRVVGQVRNDAQKAFTTGFTGSIAGAVAGSPAYDLKQNLDTLRANAAFDTLQNMRNNSPTGGALGAISEKELSLLEAAFTNLNNSQSYDQFMQNLQAFETQNQASLEAMKRAYNEDYQRFGGQRDQFLPAPGAAVPAANKDQGVVNWEDLP